MPKQLAYFSPRPPRSARGAAPFTSFFMGAIHPRAKAIVGAATLNATGEDSNNDEEDSER